MSVPFYFQRKRFHARECSAVAAAVTAFFFFVCVAVAAPDQAPAPQSKEDPSAGSEMVERQVKELEAEVERLTDEKVKAEVRGHLQKANGFLKDAAREEADRKKLEQEAAGASEELKKLHEQEQAAAAPPPKVGENVTPEELQQLSVQSVKGRTEAERAQQTERRRKESFERRRVKAEDDVKSLQKRLAAIAADWKTIEKGEATELARARQLSLRAEYRASRRRIETLDTLKRLADVLGPLYEKRLAVAAAEARQAEQRDEALRQEMHQRREMAVLLRRDEAQARLAEVQVHPQLVSLATENVELAEEIITVVNHSKQAAKDLERRRKQAKTLEETIASTEKKVEAVGLTNAIGLLLRNQKAKLPPVDTYRQSSKLRQAEIGSAQYRLFELDDQYRKLDPEKLDPLVEELDEQWFAATELPGGEDQREHLKVELRKLLVEKRALLKLLKSDLDGYFKNLTDLDVEEQSLIKKVESYSTFINERILWVQSTSPLGLSDAADSWEAAQWLFGPDAWREVGTALLASFKEGPLPVVTFALLVLVPWLAARRRLRQRLRELGKVASARTAQHYLPTLEAVLYTSLMAGFYPALLWFVGWQLERATVASHLPSTVAAGLITAALVYFPLEFVRQLCRRHGLAEAHFGWPEAVLALVRVRLRRLMCLGLPLIFVAAALNAQDHVAFDNSLGRLAFIGLLLVITAALAALLRPSGPIVRHIALRKPDGWFYRLRNVTYGMSLLSPLALAVLAAIGFYYTAWQLAMCLQATLHLGLALIVATALIERWLLVNHRHMAIEQRKAALKESTAAPAETHATAMAGISTELPPEMDLTAVSEQTRRLLNAMLLVAGVVGLWWIWSTVLPALNILKSVPLWTTSFGELVKAVSLADLAMAALVVAVTVVAARNVPGLLQITILQRLPIDAGMRYAIDNVSRYLIVVVGVAIAFSLIGIGWDKIQWLAAGVSVGLGFGLQEIFANFVAGLIILFEQPVRVGDVVTIEGSTGVVSKIRIRATTITTWDRQELIVPNKEFIMGRLLNWTLSDHINRVMVNVGVAYGADTRQVTELLLKIARKHPDVLHDPAPTVAFESFGNSTLNFVLRVYLAELEERLDVIHDLHSAIHDEFNKAGIEIAFPQQDIHIRSLPAGVTLSPSHQRAA